MATASLPPTPGQQSGDCPNLNLHDLKERQLELEKVDFKGEKSSSKQRSPVPEHHEKPKTRKSQPATALSPTDVLTLPVSPPPQKSILYGCDRVVKLNMDGELVLGFVVINRKTGTVVVDWDDGRDEHLGSVEGKGVTLVNKMGILDRRCVGYGSKVTDGTKVGHVVEKRFLVSLVLESNTNVVIVDVPCEELIRPGYSKMGDKVIFGDEWLGLVADTRAGLYFKMDKDGKLGYVPDDSYGFIFPRPGDKLKSMMIYHLWDSVWITTGQTWWWNFFKYLGNSATILDTKIDCMTLAWMGHLQRGSVCKEEENALPPNTLRKAEDLREVRHLYGRNWRYIREYDSWDYTLKKEDKVMDFHDYVVQLSNNLFFGPDQDYIDMGSSGDENKLELEPEKTLAAKIASCRSVVDIEWDDGTMDTLPSYRVQPYHYVGSDSTTQFFMGDIVCDMGEKGNKEFHDLTQYSQYGFIVRVYQSTAEVKWVIPSMEGHVPKVSAHTMVELSELGLHPNYLFLKSLHQLPVAVSNVKNQAGKRISVDGVKLGVVVGVNVAEAKLVMKCTDEIERLVWAHDFEHFEGDVAHNPILNKWISWYKRDEKRNPIMNYCMADKFLHPKTPPSFMSTVVEAADEDSQSPTPKIVKFLQKLYSP